MACDPNTLIEQAKCIHTCIPQGMLPAVNTSLLCQILDVVTAVFPTNGLIHYWKLEEAAGSPRLDSVGSLTLSETLGNILQVAGKRGNAAQVSGAFLSTVAWTLPAAFSIAFWARVDADPPGDVYNILQKIPAVDNLFIGVSDLAVPQAKIGSAFLLWSSTISQGTYHLFVITYSSGSCAFSFDGGAFLISATAFTEANSVMVLHDATSDFTFNVDEVGIWNRALSQSEVNSIWNGGAGRFLI
jgi:hypothetical protein